MFLMKVSSLVSSVYLAKTDLILILNCKVDCSPTVPYTRCSEVTHTVDALIIISLGT